MEFEYFKVSQATGPELEYLRVGIGVISRYLKPRAWYFKRRGWNWSMSRYLKLRRWNLSISSYGDGIGVYQGISSYGYLKVSQATEVEFEYLKVSKLRGWNWSTSGLELEYIKVSQATGLVSQATGL